MTLYVLGVIGLLAVSDVCAWSWWYELAVLFVWAIAHTCISHSKERSE